VRVERRPDAVPAEREYGKKDIVKLHSGSRDISFTHRMASMPFIVSISQKYFALCPL
jgi:hypothetical protein